MNTVIIAVSRSTAEGAPAPMSDEQLLARRSGRIGSGASSAVERLATTAVFARSGGNG